MIAPTAIIDPSATLADSVSVGPYSVIGPDVQVGEGTIVESHVVIKGPTTIGKNNHIYQFASVGEAPQDKKYAGEKTFLEIGDNNVIREGCTISRGTVQDNSVTKIGNDNLFMAYVHIAHDCIIGNNVILANNVAVAGHSQIDDHAILGGFTGVHQFCKLGAYCFTSVNTFVSKDVLPYVTVSGADKAKAFGLNSEGLKRHGFSSETLKVLKRAFKIICRENLTTAEAIEKLASMPEKLPEVDRFIDFLKASNRGIVR